MDITKIRVLGNYRWYLRRDKSLGCLFIEVIKSTTLNFMGQRNLKGFTTTCVGKLEICISLFMQFGVFGYALPLARISERF
jgi:hypothetical protein